MTRIGSYDVVETLGHGPHGAALLGVEPVMGRTVVIKPLDSLEGLDANVDTALEASFGVTSSWLARPLGTGRHDGRPYVVREYINGLDLGRLRATGRSFDLPFALGILAATARGIAALHAVRFAHGNLRLSNIFVTRTGELRVADPAIFARLADSSPAGLAAGRLGALTMLPPERLQGGAPALPDDIFALGALGFWLLADGWPFEASDPVRLAAEIRETPPGGRPDRAAPASHGLPRAQLPASAPPALTELLLACLRPDAASRPAAASELVRSLDAVAVSLDFDVEDALHDGLKGMSLAFMTAREPKRSAAPSSAPLPEFEPPRATLKSSPVARLMAPAGAFDVEPTPEPGSKPADGRTEPTMAPRNDGAPPSGQSSPLPPFAAAGTKAPPRPFVPPPAMLGPAGAPSGDRSPGKKASSDGRSRALPAVGSEPPMLAVKAPDLSPMGGKRGISWAPGLVAAALIGAMVWYGLRGKGDPEAPTTTSSPGKAGSAADSTSLVAAKAAADSSPDEALRTALVAARELPTSGEAQLLLAKAYARKGRAAEAAAASILAAERLPESVEAQRTATSLLLAAGRPTDAASLATTAVERHSSDAALQLLRGQALRADRRLDEASEALTLSVELDGERAEAWVVKGEVDFERVRYQAARDAFSRAIQLSPKLGRAYAGLGQALVGLGRGGEAVELLKRGLDVASDPNAVRFAVGWVLLRDGKTDDALVHLKRHAADNPQDARSQLALGVALLRTGHPRDAAAALKASTSFDSSVAEAHFDLAMAELGLGNVDAAEEAFKRSTEARFGFWPAHCERGRLLYRLKRYDASKAGLMTALQLQPGLAVADGLLNTADGSTAGELIAGVPCGPSSWLPDG